MRLTAPKNSLLSLIGAYIAYPIGKILLRVLTLGRYPPEEKKHNVLFVALFPWFAFLVIAVIAYN